MRIRSQAMGGQEVKIKFRNKNQDKTKRSKKIEAKKSEAKDQKQKKSGLRRGHRSVGS
jgi:BMFP domain-containing protein YqiC